ncbi:MAG: hypothetical protein FWG33_04355 [Oscillospiraceae bacterium]|nr:hypothetical protein [Oscillospiraceae bacterium]
MNNNDLALCPKCHTTVSIYTPDCPTCGYFIWGDDEEDLEPGVSGISSSFKEDFADEDAFEDYCDYNDSDFVDFDFSDWEDDDLEN